MVKDVGFVFDLFSEIRMAAGAREFAKANEHFVAEEYDLAAAYFDKAISKQGNQAKYYLHRSANHLKKGSYAAALQDVEQAEKLSPETAIGCLRKGIALFSLDQFERSHEAFLRAEALGLVDRVRIWKRKCEAELKIRPGEGAAQPASAANSSLCAEHAATSSSAAAAAQLQSSTAPTSTFSPAAAPQPKIKTDWFQTVDKVTLVIFVKRLFRQDVVVECTDSVLSVKLNCTPKPFKAEYALWAKVHPNPEVQVTPYKVEIMLKKQQRQDWDSLEAASVPVSSASAPIRRENIVSTGGARPSVYTKVKKDVDWDALQTEEEQVDGDAALEKLFQQIYADGDENTKRAMMKSYQTSGGTVLSTNWQDVANKDYSKNRTAPPGQEFRKLND